MGYYIRVLGTQDPNIHIDELIGALNAEGLSAQFLFDPTEQPDKWTMLDIKNDSGEAIMQIERNPVIEGELGKEELNEFKEIIQDFKPVSAVKWLTDFFENVIVIYAFQLLNAAFADDNFKIMSALKAKIWNQTNGILQADNEGFSNEDGYHILWQFFDDVTGNWSCAVLDTTGNWQKFIMDLGDKNQRAKYESGQVPENASLL